MAIGTKGRFVPKHPEKYIGNVDNIIFRSRWELTFMNFCDNNVNIINWGSEEIKIPYIKPATQKIHHYYPDFFIVYKNASGQIVKELIEIKPKKEAVLSKKSSLYDKVAILTNHAKWEAAQQFCKRNGLTFRVLTEDSLFRTGTTKQKPKREVKQK